MRDGSGTAAMQEMIRHHEPWRGGRLRPPSRAQLDRFLPLPKIAEPCSAGRTRASAPTWFVALLYILPWLVTRFRLALSISSASRTISLRISACGGELCFTDVHLESG